MRPSRSARSACALAFLLPLIFAAPVVGQPADSSAQPIARRGVSDRAELEAFIDGVMAAQLADKHVAGATVAVVKDGALFFSKGYGYADVAKRKPVDPARTMFRIGSVSKLFTWTAVMQLVEEGKIDLEADVNTYLDFKIPDTYPEPIRIRHLLTHTPGLEEDGRDLFTTDSAHMKPMGEWLPSHMPKRVRPPGTFSSYSNWGTAVAGYIVERVSGMSFDDYVEQRMLGPLGMSYTTTRQPLPAQFAGDMSVGYGYENGKFAAKEWEIITGAAPAGSVSASAEDMAKWMLVHLGDGQLGEQRILGAATAEQMHTRSFTHDPRLPGWALGFYEKSSHRVRIIGHGGDTQWFHSDLALIPSENLGVFVSFNTNTGGALSFGPFLQAFLDHYYPEPPPEVRRRGDLARFAGTYLFNRMSYTTFQKAMGLASAIPVQVGDDTTLVVATPFGKIRLAEVDSLLFRDVNGQAMAAFRVDERGKVTHGFVSMAPMMTLERQPWYRVPRLHLGVLAVSLFFFAVTVITAVTRWLRRRREGGAVEPRSLSVGRRLLVGAAVANLVFVLATAAVLSDVNALMAGQTAGLKIALAFPVLALVLMLGALFYGVRQWREKAGRVWERLRYASVVVLGLLFAWSLNAWNLLGWRF